MDANKGAVICGRRAGFLKRACTILERETGKQCLYKVCNVRDYQACQAAVQYCVHQLGALDILINCAAGNFLSEASALSPKGFRTVMEIDAAGTFHMAHAAHLALAESVDGGVVINISATLQYGATWYQCHASAAKSAVDSLTRSWALEWGNDNIRVVGIAPGPIADTPGTTKLAPGLDSGDVEEMVREGIPLGRMGKTWDIGMTAVFLCSAAAGYITGDTVVVDGGQWLYRPPMVPRELVAELSRNVEAKSRAQGPRSRL